MRSLEIRGGDRLRLTYHSPDVEQPRFQNLADLAGFKGAGEIEVQVLDLDGFEVARMTMPLPIMRALLECGEALLDNAEVKKMAESHQPSGLVGMRRFINHALGPR